MQKNDIITLKICDLTSDGSGIAKYNGMAIFVPLTAVGDIVEAKILKTKKTYAYAKVLNIIEPSQDRCDNDCKVYNQCGGCSSRHINYKSECLSKQKRVEDAIKRIGGINISSNNIIPAIKSDRYRNKAQYPIGEDNKIGFYAIHSHRIIKSESCLLQPQIFENIVMATEKWIQSYKISIYNEEKSKGLLRHLYIRFAEKTNELMITLVINGTSLPFSEEYITELKSICKESLKSVQININREKTNVILGKKCKVLFGQPYITDLLCGIKIRLSPLSFYQVNRDMAEILYKKAHEYAKPSDKTILDLYCGAGTIGLSMAKSAKKIIGVEIIEDAVKDACFNAQSNNIKNAEFICSDAKSAAEKLYEEGIKPDVVVIDPPRKGCEEELIKTIANDFKPQRIVYVSCDPATLARDLKIFEQFSYNLIEYTPVDLFPRTSHVETVALIINNK